MGALMRRPTGRGNAHCLDAEGTVILQEALTMKEGTMNTGITMGNDEFILYIRKNYPKCSKGNDDLGQRIWGWIRGNDATAYKVDKDGNRDDNAEPVSCSWSETDARVVEAKLPYTATQFRFERSLLPSLYEHLEALGTA
jgi:hypothetical protein